jgi:hypothetical protein
MFCSNCGARASGNFCSSCGSRLTVPTAEIAASPAPPKLAPELEGLVPARAAAPPVLRASAPTPESSGLAGHGWWQEHRYEELLQYSDVRQAIVEHARQAPKGLSAEEFLKHCDAIFKPMGPIPMTSVAAIIVPMYASWGIEMKRTRSQTFAHPVGKTIVAVLCSLARTGRKLKEVHQGEDGCIVEALLPSDMWSWEGEILVTIQRASHGSHVSAATRVPGSLFDWGKSSKCLDDLMKDCQWLLR